MMSENRERIAEDLLDDIGSTSEQLLAVLEDLRFVVAPERALEVAKNTAVPTDLIERGGPLMPLASDKGIALTISVPEQTEAFEMHDQALRQVINNLVNNAIKHSRGSQISVQFDYQWQSIDHAPRFYVLRTTALEFLKLPETRSLNPLSKASAGTAMALDSD